MRRFSLILLLLLVISLFNFRVVSLPTTTLTFKVLERDYNQYLKLDFEGSDELGYSYTISVNDDNGGLTYEDPTISTDYAHSGSHSLRFYCDDSNPTSTTTLIYKLDHLHEIYYKYKLDSYGSYTDVKIQVYVDGTLVEEYTCGGGVYESDWKMQEKGKNDPCDGIRELKVVIEITLRTATETGGGRAWFYIDDGKRYKDVVVEKSLTVEYWSERIDVDKYRVHYVLDSSQLSGTWWVAYIEGDYYLEEGNGGRYGGLYFDGSDDYVEIEFSKSLYIWKGNSNCTFEVYVKPSFTIPSDEIKSVLWFKDSEGTGRCVIAVCIRGDWYSYMGGDNLFSEVYAVKEEYAHVVLRYYNGILRFFVNGEGAGSSERSIDEGKVGNLVVGRRKCNVNYWHGVINYIAFYNRSLSLDEIEENYNNEEALLCPALTLYLAPWSIDPYSGYWYDISGSNHGTIYGASVSSEKALGLTLCPGSTEWKFYRDYTESSYPHDYYFVIFRFDNGTLSNSTVTINFGTSEEDVSNWLWYKDADSITQEFYTIKNGSDWYRHFRVHPSVTAYVPTPGDTYSYITFNIHDYTQEFVNSSLLVYDTKSRLIQEELITSTYQAVCYLKPYGSYLLVIRKDTEERVIGWVVIDSATKDLYVGVTPPAYSELLETVSYNVTEGDSELVITIEAEGNIDVTVEIYNNTGKEFTYTAENVNIVSITYIYDTKTMRTVYIKVSDPSLGEERTIIAYRGTQITPPETLERLPTPLSLFNLTFYSLPDELRGLGLENLLVYCIAIAIFLVLCTKFTLGIGCIGAGITILFMKAWIGNVTYPDLIASVVIVLGGLYEFTRRR